MTLIEAKKNMPENPDERLVLELVHAFAKINNIEQANELVKLIKTKYEKAMAFAFIGKELAKNKNFKKMDQYLNKSKEMAPDLIVGNYEFSGLPGFSTKGRIFSSLSKTYALANNFDKSYELIGAIESDRFYKEAVSDVLIIQAKKDKKGAKELATKLINHGGKIVDTKLLGKIANAQAICGDFENSLISLNKMELGFDFSQTLINIANYFSPQQASPLI